MIIFLFALFTGTAYGQKSLLKLDDAVETGLKNNPAVQVSLKKIDEAKAKITYGISLPQPTVSLSYELTPDGKSLRDFGERTFEINQPFEFPTKYFTRGSRLSKDVEIAETRYELSKFDVAARIKSAYFSAVYRQMDLKLAEEDLQIAEDFLFKSQIRYNVGEGTNLELLTAKVQKTEALNMLETSKSELKSALTVLVNEMGMTGSGGIAFELTDSLNYISYGFTEESLLSAALLNNPNLKVSDLNIDASSLDKSLAWQNLLPDMNFSYYRQAIPGDTRFYGVSLGISVPLWFMFEHRGKIQEAQTNYSIAGMERKTVLNGIITDVKNNLNEFRNCEREVLLYRNEILPQADEVFRTAKVSYEQGEANYLLLLEAKKTLVTAKDNFIASLYRYKLALIKLEQSVGKKLEK